MSGYSRRCRRVVNEYLESAWPRVHRAFYRCTRSRSTPEERLGCVSTGITPRGGSRVKSGHGRNSIDETRLRSSLVNRSNFFIFFFPFETKFFLRRIRRSGIRIRSNIRRPTVYPISRALIRGQQRMRTSMNNSVLMEACMFNA